MASYQVKVSRYKGQTRITIPRKLAVDTGLDKAKIVTVFKLWKRGVGIERYSGKETGQGRHKEHRAGSD